MNRLIDFIQSSVLLGLYLTFKPTAFAVSQASVFFVLHLIFTVKKPSF